jgi:5,10-methylenetetrahydrofolate reductase
MPELSQALGQKDFVVTVELDPPRGVDVSKALALAGRLTGRVDAVVVSDHRQACLHQSPWWLAHLLQERAGLAAVMTLTCRDRNRLALTGDILAAAAAGVRELLLVSGDFVSLGDHPGAKPVYDLDSVQALQLARGLAGGKDLAGQALEGAPELYLGAVAALAAKPLEPQLIKFRKKIQAGAAFFISRPLKAVEELRAFLERHGPLGVPLIVGVEAKGAEDMSAAAALFKQLRDSRLAAGAHLSLPGAQDSLPDLLSACGL